MRGYAAIMKKTGTAIRTLREAGVRGFVAKVRHKVYVWRVCYSARKVASVTLDGSVIGLSMIPNNGMKVSLLKQKYERFERRAVVQYIRPEFPVVELGACIGVVSCVTNGVLRDPERHVVVEANPHVIPILMENRDRNQCKFEVLNRAISYDHPAVTFSPSSDFRGTSLQRAERGSYREPAVTVSTTGLGEIVAQRGYDRFTLICDIEGQEYELVAREPDVLKRVETFILETHARLIGDARNTEMMEKLKGLGFKTIDQDSYVVVLRRQDIC